MTAVLVCAVIMLVLHLLTPYWWWVMIVPFAYGATAKSGWKALRTGFLAAGLLWLGGGLYFFLTGSGIVAARMARMFGLVVSWLMIPVTALIAAIVAAFAGTAGYAIRKLFKNTPRQDFGSSE
jgi:hypothetical protein